MRYVPSTATKGLTTTKKLVVDRERFNAVDLDSSGEV